MGKGAKGKVDIDVKVLHMVMGLEEYLNLDHTYKNLQSYTLRHSKRILGKICVDLDFYAAIREVQRKRQGK